MEKKQEVKKKKPLRLAGGNLIIQVSKTYDQFRHREEAWRSLEALLTLMTVILLGIFAISPTVKAISSLVSEINNKEELSEKMQGKIGQMIQAQTLYAQIQQEVFLLDQYYPSNPQLALGFTQLAGLAQKQGLTVSNLTLKEVDFNNLPLGLDFSFSVRGNYEQNKSFLSSFYQSRRGIVVDGFQMEKDEKAEGEVINTSFRGKMLFSSEVVKK